MERKNNKNRNIFIGVIVALLLIGGVVFAVSRSNDDAASETEANTTQSSPTTVEKSETEKMYETYTGEDYDRMFIANMIAHHQGAVDMAKLAQSNAGRSEIKSLADAIVSAQEKEITDMLAWQKQWGYPASSGEMMMDHSSMGMMDDMDGMTEQLKGLTGADFDKKFIELMIEHHQSAIDMAKPGAKNAYHQEVKDLAAAVVRDQTTEISQMKQWQEEWGY